MLKKLDLFIEENQEQVFALLQSFFEIKKSLLVRSEIWDTFTDFCASTNTPDLCQTVLGDMSKACQEAVLIYPWVYLAVRPHVARWHHFAFNMKDKTFCRVSVSQFLDFKEKIIQNGHEDILLPLEIDLTPFNRDFPKLRESNSIGKGVEFLNRNLSSRLFMEMGSGSNRLLTFLTLHQYDGKQLMLNDTIKDIEELRLALRNANRYLRVQDPDLSWDKVYPKLQEFGFEPGWGRNVSKISETINLLRDVLEAPAPTNLALFLSRIPMIFRIAILSPHGYFGQSNVLGMPDTGGQVVYILDQVRALEAEMCKSFFDLGLSIKTQILVVTRMIPESAGTTCNQYLENIDGTNYAKILRVPFYDKDNKIIPNWISRFKIWPYLERFALDAEKEIIKTLGAKPDFIIGNYSDGNLVGSILAQRLRVTQCNIAHALEKTKYLFSDLYWKDNEKNYHFSCQFTADLIAMNSADFIITSTYQEIAGRQDEVGQYESYSAFTMPGLYRVVNGINMFDPKFNIVSPGANEQLYFPYFEKEKRIESLQKEFSKMIYEKYPQTLGNIKNKKKPLILTMARLDKIKNLTGLVEWYAKNKKLQKVANLFVIGGHIDPTQSEDTEEQEQIKLMHKIFKKYDLKDNVRWLGSHFPKDMTGELYRYIADTKGIFMQPALFEAFGLTVIEAMTSGLPTFATRYGGPLEIIEHGISGFHIDPNHPQEVTDSLVEFFEKSKKDPKYWEAISQASIDRVEAEYTWSLYAEKLLSLSRIYGFWKYVSNLERDETRRYLEMFYSLQYRPRAEKVNE
jgi:sucrose synthase